MDQQNEMVERVAKALVASRNLPDGCLINWDVFRADARAAIEAMREPTDAMLESCGNGECGKWARGAWMNMIDAALSAATKSEVQK